MFRAGRIVLAGLLAVSLLTAGTVAASAEATPPPDDLQASYEEKSRELVLSWEAPTADIVEYRVYVNGAQVATIERENTTVDDFQRHDVAHVTAVDADGDESRPSNPVVGDQVVRADSIQQGPCLGVQPTEIPPFVVDFSCLDDVIEIQQSDRHPVSVEQLVSFNGSSQIGPHEGG